MDDLLEEDSHVDPEGIVSGSIEEDVYELLSEIITQVNGVHGLNLTEEHKVFLSGVRKRLEEDESIRQVLDGDNSEDNKRSFAMEKYDSQLIGLVQSNTEFYKQLMDNPSAKNMIFEMMYKGIQNQQLDTKKL